MIACAGDFPPPIHTTMKSMDDEWHDKNKTFCPASLQVSLDLAQQISPLNTATFCCQCFFCGNQLDKLLFSNIKSLNGHVIVISISMPQTCFVGSHHSQFIN